MYHPQNKENDQSPIFQSSALVNFVLLLHDAISFFIFLLPVTNSSEWYVVEREENVVDGSL